MATLELDEATKLFQEDDDPVVAVDEISLDIEDSEFIVLVGPSGCGKSTTLRLIAGLETISSGTVAIDDAVINDEKPKDRNIAMVFQNYALYPQKTVSENMSFGLEMATDLSADEIKERVESTAEMLGIGDLLNRKPNALSGGQKQRVALGRAIVRDPKVFLMDEPLSNLDAKLRTKMRTEIQELQKELGVTTVYVTHDQTEAMTMGDRIVILKDGKLQQVGTPLECYYEPTNIFVAGFIGSPSMNFSTLVFSEGIGQSDDVHYSFSSEHAAEIRKESESERITLGIRPEDIELASGQGEHTVESTVNVIEPMGKETYVHFELDGEEMVAAIAGNLHFDAGDTIYLRFPEEKIHVFDSETGRTIFNCEKTDASANEVNYN
ncbi:carbohydrate ABC transporter ATP-binding protein, CUT1 family [Haladaptatus litoreus]|uniref:ABC-type D-xylose/L-arabinose transporter n=1 Tax=Haladaptatus litoreus TaxID=553468 RepID=A0A1N7CRB0_9EURY|nr:sn-glycerol-3-phosphate ABC transporter ATP-binding protein UgpC [Haladaptatus litoreus]SIR66111.1 carbohydrate ABC transporter ATP-binding protein, CUT1 family [Haladaptatus litoreus]